MMKKRYLLSLVAALIFVSGVASATPDPNEQVTYAKCPAVQHYDAVVASHAAGPLILLPSLDAYRSHLFRSDMRVASAGLVFNRAVNEIRSVSTLSF